MAPQAATPLPTHMLPLQARILARLDALGIDYTCQTHAPVLTMADAAAVRPGLLDVPHCKNLCLTPVRRAQGRVFLLVLQEHKRADLRDIAAQIGTAKLQLVPPDVLLETLGVTPGAVSPLALVHPGAREVTVLLDSALAEQPMVCFHPGVNTASLAMATGDLMRFLDAVGNARQTVIA